MSPMVSPIFNIAEEIFGITDEIFEAAELNTVTGGQRTSPRPYGEKAPAGG
jgi:hypothetical protein